MVSKALGVLERWGEHGMALLLDMLETGAIADHYGFTNAVMDMASSSPSFRELLRSQAEAADGVARELLEVLNEEKELDGLASRLASEIFPEEWPVVTHQNG